MVAEAATAQINAVLADQALTSLADAAATLALAVLDSVLASVLDIGHGVICKRAKKEQTQEEGAKGDR